MLRQKYDLSRNEGLRWHFECWGDDGKIYQHEHNWSVFKRRMEEYGGWYPHNWLHNRSYVLLYTPKTRLWDLPGYEDYKIREVADGWSVICEAYPAHVRTASNPDGEEPSFHLWIEDRHPKPTYGDPVVLLSHAKDVKDSWSVAYFRGQYWVAADYKEYGLGPYPPSDEESNRFATAGKTKYLYRSLDDE